MARLTQIDYDREMAFVAVERGDEGRDLTLGVARAVADPDNVRAEFAIIMRSDMKGRGLGAILLKKIIRYCQDRGTQELVGQVLAENTRMLNLAKNLGFTAERLLSDDTVGLRLAL
jgi:acetyltransferase